MNTCRWCAQRLIQIHRRRYSSSNGSPRDYDAAVAVLNSLQSNFSIVEAIKKRGPAWNQQALPEMREWLRRIGYETSDFDRLNPVHIAGTKGKGSTSAFISSILAQYLPAKKSIHAERLPSSVGLYTSPHLRFVRERIKINNESISEELFAKYFWEVWDRLEATSPSSATSGGRSKDGKPVYFHYLTLMALHCFLQQSVGSAVIECGIGGEYDTTNVLERPSVTGVTSLGIDHQSLLGDTIDSIAWHKAGIFKPSVPAFTAPQPPEALKVLQERAKERQTELHLVNRHTAIDDIRLGLNGDFQKTNASLAIAIAACHLQRLGYTGIPDPLHAQSDLPEEFVKGLENARLGGRCDIREDRKTCATWFIDGAHTQESIEVAAQWFAAAVRARRIERTRASRVGQRDSVRVLVFNQQTRDAPALVERLFKTLSDPSQSSHPWDNDHPLDVVIFCPNVTYKNAGYKPDLVSINTNADDISSLRVQHELAKVWKRLDSSTDVLVVGTIEEAVRKVRQISRKVSDPVEVLATGSLHLVGGVIEVLETIDIRDEERDGT